MIDPNRVFARLADMGVPKLADRMLPVTAAATEAADEDTSMGFWVREATLLDQEDIACASGFSSCSRLLRLPMSWARSCCA